MGVAYPYMDLNAKYEKFTMNKYDVLLRMIQIRISPKRGSAREIATCKQNGPIQRMGAVPRVIHTGRVFVPIPLYVVGKINGGER
jgi:hypothetical protein